MSSQLNDSRPTLEALDRIYNWPHPTTKLRWCPDCKLWTVPRRVHGDRCRCGAELGATWDAAVEEKPRSA